jgi:hypothetical protein
MAKAIVSEVLAAEPGTPAGRVTLTYTVFYAGTDIPGGINFDQDIVRVENVDLSIQPSQIQSAIASAVRTRATTLGINVGANEIILCGLAKG